VTADDVSTAPLRRSSYGVMIRCMTTDRVTVSLPAEVRRAAQRIAQETGVPFSTVVADALSAWVRGRLVDAWLSEHQAEFGTFDETELRRIAEEAGVTYLPPLKTRTVA
jgi:hypothetical protein